MRSEEHVELVEGLVEALGSLRGVVYRVQAHQGKTGFQVESTVVYPFHHQSSFETGWWCFQTKASSRVNKLLAHLRLTVAASTMVITPPMMAALATAPPTRELPAT